MRKGMIFRNLFFGITLMGLQASGAILKRQPTRPFTKENTAVCQLKSEFDAARAVIVPNDAADGMVLAGKVQQELKKRWGVELPIHRVSNHSDGDENLILCGRGMANILSRELAANQQIVRDIAGAELRVFPEALDWKRGVVYLGGRNEAEVLAALEALVKRYPLPDKLKFTIEVLHGVKTPDPGPRVAEAKTLLSGKEERRMELVLSTYLREAVENYQMTGDGRYVRAFSEILEKLCEIYPANLAALECAPTFEFHRFPQYLYLIENSPDFSDADRIKAAEFIRAVLEKAFDSWQLNGPAKCYAEGKKKYFTNHYCFASRTAAVSARYLLSRYSYKPAEYFLAVGENTFEGVQTCPLSPEDAGGYQYLVYSIFMDYMVSSGKFDQTVMMSPEFKEYAEYTKSLINHLGYTPGYGDAYSTGMCGPFFLLREIMEATGDPESEQLLSLIARTLDASDTALIRKCKEWEINRNLPPINDPRFSGLRVLAVSPARQELLNLTATKLRKLDKAVFRSSWRPDAEFLAVTGLNGAPHGHDDAVGVSQYLVGPHLWLLEGDYIRRAVEDHNLVSIIHNGTGLIRQRDMIPDLERFAQVAGEVQNAEKNMALLSLVIEKCNGIDYFRHIGWAAGGGLWIIDELRAVEPGDYRFVSRWRTTGDLASHHEQGVTVKQLPAPNDGGLSAFSIAEGTGAAQFGYSEFERTHGRPNQSLRYSYSNGEIRTRIYWKDAVLKAGEKTFFVQHFRAVPGEKPEAVMIEEIAPGIFAAGRGEARSTISMGNGIIFSSRQGRLALPADAKSPESAGASSGVVKSNVAPAIPADATRSKSVLLAEYEAQISAVAGGKETFAIGLENGRFLLFDRAGKVKAEKKFPTEVSAIAAIPTPAGECFAVGLRAVSIGQAAAAGTLCFLDASGQELWRKEIPPCISRRRPGTPAVIFPAHLTGKDQSPAIVVGAEAWKYFAFDSTGKQLWDKDVLHAATAGAAGDFDGDGYDEIYGGVEYYWREIFDSKGKTLLPDHANSTSQWDTVAVFGAVPPNGPKRVFAARQDGYLYTVSPETSGIEPWSVRLAGPAYGMVLLPEAVAAATINGYIIMVNGDGKITGSIKLPAPLTGLAARHNLLYAPGLDGRVYAVDPDLKKTVGVFDCAALTGMERFIPKLVVVDGSVFSVFGKQIHRIK